MEIQLSPDGAPQALQTHGPALLGALMPRGDGLSPEEWHVLMHADREERDELLALLASWGTAE